MIALLEKYGATSSTVGHKRFREDAGGPLLSRISPEPSQAQRNRVSSTQATTASAAGFDAQQNRSPSVHQAAIFLASSSSAVPSLKSTTTLQGQLDASQSSISRPSSHPVAPDPEAPSATASSSARSMEKDVWDAIIVRRKAAYQKVKMLKELQGMDPAMVTEEELRAAIAEFKSI